MKKLNLAKSSRRLHHLHFPAHLAEHPYFNNFDQHNYPDAVYGYIMSHDTPIIANPSHLKLFSPVYLAQNESFRHQKHQSRALKTPCTACVTYYLQI